LELFAPSPLVYRAPCRPLLASPSSAPRFALPAPFFLTCETSDRQAVRGGRTAVYFSATTASHRHRQQDERGSSRKRLGLDRVDPPARENFPSPAASRLGCRICSRRSLDPLGNLSASRFICRTTALPSQSWWRVWANPREKWTPALLTWLVTERAGESAPAGAPKQPSREEVQGIGAPSLKGCISAFASLPLLVLYTFSTGLASVHSLLAMPSDYTPNLVSSALRRVFSLLGADLSPLPFFRPRRLFLASRLSPTPLTILFHVATPSHFLLLLSWIASNSDPRLHLRIARGLLLRLRQWMVGGKFILFRRPRAGERAEDL
jgi:hypothetical protein